MIVSLIIGAYLLILVLFNFGPLHHRFNQWVTQTLCDYFQTEISIGNIELKLFNHVRLSDVLIYPSWFQSG